MPAQPDEPGSCSPGHMVLETSREPEAPLWLSLGEPHIDSPPEAWLLGELDGGDRLFFSLPCLSGEPAVLRAAARVPCLLTLAGGRRTRATIYRHDHKRLVHDCDN